MIQQSLLLIKPNAVIHHHVGHIISMLEDAGFVLSNIKEFQFSPESAGEFYEVHRGKEFFGRLIDFMCSGPTVGLIVEKENAIDDLRDLIGAVEPEKRHGGTIRAKYAEGITENAVHASDSIEHAQREIQLIFGSNVTNN